MIFDPELIPGFREADDNEMVSRYVCEACRAPCNKLYEILTDDGAELVALAQVCAACWQKVMEVLKLA